MVFQMTMVICPWMKKVYRSHFFINNNYTYHIQVWEVIVWRALAMMSCINRCDGGKYNFHQTLMCFTFFWHFRQNVMWKWPKWSRMTGEFIHYSKLSLVLQSAMACCMHACSSQLLTNNQCPLTMFYTRFTVDYHVSFRADKYNTAFIGALSYCMPLLHLGDYLHSLVGSPFWSDIH